MRVYQLARQLSSRHDLTLLSQIDAGREHDVDVLRGEMEVRVVVRNPPSRHAKRTAQLLSLVSRRPFAVRSAQSPELQAAIDELCATRQFDVIQLESSVLCGLRFPESARLLLDEHNVESEVFERVWRSERSRLRRLFNRLEYIRFRRHEHRWWRRVDACALTSEREEPIVRPHTQGIPVGVVPNGVDLDYFRPREGDGEPDTVVFNGVLDYRPNVDAAQHLVDEIWPLVRRHRPQARLLIVGRGDAAERERLRRPGVELTGEVPDVRPYLAGAAVVIVPIRMGGGTRLKVVEALSMGRPMVSTPLGCEGVNVRAGAHLLVAEGAEPFAAAVVRLLEDRRLAGELGRAGRTRMEEEYSWDLAGDRLEGLYRRMLGRSDAEPGSAVPASLAAGAL
jgi:glycosyltransferase involved in cell wall biosynthesis